MSEEEHKYVLASRWVKEKIVAIEIDGKESLRVATPPDFWPGGPTGILSPEDLFVASAVSCFGVSLSGASERYHASLKDFHLTGTGTLQKGESGWEFAKITIGATIMVLTDDDKKKMARAAERAHSHCVVANSMKCPVHLDYEIIVG